MHNELMRMEGKETRRRGIQVAGENSSFQLSKDSKAIGRRPPVLQNAYQRPCERENLMGTDSQKRGLRVSLYERSAMMRFRGRGDGANQIAS